MRKHEHTRECGFCDKVLSGALTWVLPLVAVAVVAIGCVTCVAVSRL